MYELPDQFDSAWVINLKHRGDRLDSFIKGSKYFAQPVSVHSVEVPPKAPEHWSCSVEAFGCANSHWEVLSQSHGLTIVFEDDAVIPPNFSDVISEIIYEAPRDWEMIVPGYHQTGKAVQVTSDLALAQGFQQTHCYILRDDRVIQVVKDIALRSRIHWDVNLGRAMSFRGRTYLVTPNLVMQAGLGSDIPDSGTER